MLAAFITIEDLESSGNQLGDSFPQGLSFTPAGPRLSLFPQACPFIPAGPALYSRRAGAGAPGMQLLPSLRRREQNLNLNAQLLAGASASDLPATGVWVAGSLARSLWPGECHPAQSTDRHAAACKLVQSLACY